MRGWCKKSSALSFIAAARFFFGSKARGCAGEDVDLHAFLAGDKEGCAPRRTRVKRMKFVDGEVGSGYSRLIFLGIFPRQAERRV